MSDRIGRRQWEAMFAEAAASIRREHRRLSELDSIGGDGDHGATMLRVVEQMERMERSGEAGSGQPPDSNRDGGLGDLLRSSGWRVLSVDGGASSALLGALLTGMAESVARPDAAGADASPETMDCRGLADALEAGLRAVSRLTAAKPGDKTMMDALVPAVLAVRAAADEDKSIAAAMREAAQAAQRGAEATRELTARYGRAKHLGDRTKGHPDAGAVSIALLFLGFSRALTDGVEIRLTP